MYDMGSSFTVKRWGWHASAALAAATGIALAGRLTATTPGQLANEATVSALPSSAWQIERVDTVGDVGHGVSLAVDTSGRPHIAYYDATDRDLKYAFFVADAWQIETVDSVGDVGSFLSLALDASDQPRIAYYNATLEDLKYSWRTGGLWQHETVDEAGSFGQYASLAVDSWGRPHIAYFDATPLGNGIPRGHLRYAVRDGALWQIQTVDTPEPWESFVGMHASLALDSFGRPHISHCAFGFLGLGSYGCSQAQYTYFDGLSWVETVVDAGVGGAELSMALDSAGDPHLGHIENNVIPIYHPLVYSRRNGSGFATIIVDLRADFSDLSLALDGSGSPAIAYQASNHGPVGYLLYTSSDGVTWSDEIVDGGASPDHPYSNSLVMNAAGCPCLAYHDALAGDLMFGRRLPVLSMTKAAEPSGGVTSGQEFTYTLSLTGPGLPVSLVDPLPANVTYVPGSVTAPAVFSPTLGAIVWQGTLPTDTTQYVQFAVAAGPGVTGTASVIVNSAWLTDTLNARSVRAVSVVNGWRLYLPAVANRHGTLP